MFAAAVPDMGYEVFILHAGISNIYKESTSWYTHGGYVVCGNG